MSLPDEAVVWEFDARDGRGEALRAMVGLLCNNLEALLPPASDDPFEQIVADLADDPTNRMLQHPRLSRLYPPALAEEKDADGFWRDSIHAQTRSRLASAEVLITAIDAHPRYVPVTMAQVGDWAKVLGALRLFWYAEVAGPGRLAEPTGEQIKTSSGLVEIIDWLGYLIEDLMQSRATCLALGEPLDPEEGWPR